MALSDESDEVLMNFYRDGNVRAFEELVLRYQTPIYHFILRSVRSPATAQELLQETFVRVIKGAKRYQQKAKFSTWLYTIARNICIDHSRRQKHRKTSSLDAQMYETGQTYVEMVPSKEGGPERKSEDNKLQQAIAQAVGELPDDQREVFLLREFQGLQFGEIAKIVGVTENTVKSRMRYALEKLRGSLQEFVTG